MSTRAQSAATCASSMPVPTSRRPTRSRSSQPASSTCGRSRMKRFTHTSSIRIACQMSHATGLTPGTGRPRTCASVRSATRSSATKRWTDS